MIEVSKMHKSFGHQQVLRGVSLTIQEGESVVIIGGSGCGKSVLLRHIIGLVQPDEGDVKIDGQSIADLSERELIKVRRKFGMLFQSAALFDSLNVEENVGFLLDREQTMSPSEIRATVADALELVDLGGTQAKKPAELSGGMKKRVGLARAIVYKPQIILYDEPTTGLDPVVADSIEQCRTRGEIFQAARAGVLDEDKPVELGNVIKHSELRRLSDDQLTVADLTGVAVQDLQISKAVYEKLSPGA